MPPLNRSGPGVETCIDCRGIWLSPATLKGCAEENESLGERHNLLNSTDPDTLLETPSSYDCPGCGSAMFHITKNGLEVERCSDCHGLYLDAGELELLLQAARQDLQRREEEHKEKPWYERDLISRDHWIHTFMRRHEGTLETAQGVGETLALVATLVELLDILA